MLSFLYLFVLSTHPSSTPLFMSSIIDGNNVSIVGCTVLGGRQIGKLYGVIYLRPCSVD